MRNLFVAISVILLVSTNRTTFAAERTAPRSTILIVLPDAPSDQARTAAMKLLQALAAEAPAGTRLVFFDGPAKQRLGEAEIPDMAAAGRIRALNRPLAPVFEHLQKTRAVRAVAVDALDLPGLVPTIASLIKTSRGETRLVLVGSPYHTDEKGATFVKGQVPSFDHILSSSSQSPLGTSDLKADLDGVRVDWLLIDYSSTRERSHVSNFWSAYFSTHLGASLCTFLDSPKDVSERAAANAADPVPAVRLAPTGKLQILTVETLKDAAAPASQPAPQAEARPVAKPFEAEPNLTQPVGRRVATVILVDGSSSMRPSLKAAAALSLETSKIGAELSSRFELGVLVHRGTGQISSWTGLVERPDADGSSKGISALRHFIDEPSIDVERITDAAGERPGKGTGENSRVTPFDCVTTTVNVEDALASALKTLEGTQADRKVLVMIGDAGPSEFDGIDGVSDLDRQSEERALNQAKKFLSANADTRIVTVFTGPDAADASFTPDHLEATKFFNKLAKVAGERGTFTSKLADMPDLTKRAILNP